MTEHRIPEAEQVQAWKHRLWRKLGIPSLTPAERRLTDTYTLLCMELGVPLYRGHVAVRHDGHLNASVNFNSRIATVTTYDLAHLSHNDVMALLAHEAGHLKAHAVGMQPDDYGAFFGIAGLGLLIATLVAPIHWLVFLLGMLVVFGGMNTVARHGECRADRYGADAVGTEPMVHLMRTTERYEQKQRKQILRYLSILSPFPFSWTQMLLVLLSFDFWRGLRKIHLTVHPAYRYRIKKLRHTANRY